MYGVTYVKPPESSRHTQSFHILFKQFSLPFRQHTVCPHDVGYVDHAYIRRPSLSFIEVGLQFMLAALMHECIGTSTHHDTRHVQ